MTYEERIDIDPEAKPEYAGKKEPLGTVEEDDLERFRAICQRNPAPAKQFDGPRRIDATVPLRRCGEWAAETVQMLRDEGVLK